MAYALQMLRSLMDARPDRAAALRVHVEALEAVIATEPQRCLERVRALFESTQHTIAPHLGITFPKDEEFPARNRRVFEAIDFSLDGHPDSEKIGTAIRKLVGSINGTVQALAELSNIPGMRHGGSLDWSALQRQHAVMLGGLSDTLITFLFEVAWARADGATAEVIAERYEDFDSFNTALDDEYEAIEIVGSTFLPSKILYTLDRTAYDSAREEWEIEKAAATADSEEAA